MIGNVLEIQKEQYGVKKSGVQSEEKNFCTEYGYGFEKKSAISFHFKQNRDYQEGLV